MEEVNCVNPFGNMDEVSSFNNVDEDNDKIMYCFDILLDQDKYEEEWNKFNNDNIEHTNPSLDDMINVLDTHKLPNGNYKLDQSIIDSNIASKWNNTGINWGTVAIKPKYSSSMPYNDAIDSMIDIAGINHINESNLEGVCDSRYLSSLIDNNPKLDEYTKHDLIDHVYGNYETYKFEKDNYHNRQKLNREVNEYRQSQYEFQIAMLLKGFSAQDICKLQRGVIYETVADTRDLSGFKEYLGVENMEQFQRHMTIAGLKCTKRNYNVSKASIGSDENINTLELAEKEVDKMCRGHKLQASKMFDKNLDNRYKDIYNVMMENK